MPLWYPIPLVKSAVDEVSGEKKGTSLLRRGAVPALPRPLGVALVCLGVAGFALVLYLRTLAPGVLHYDRPAMLDSAMFQAQLATLGITHPTGYPTYTMLGHLFTYLPVGDEAYRVNLLSAVAGAAAVALLFLAGLRLSGSIIASAVGALAFAVGDTFWSQAVIAEVYTLNAVFACLILLVLLLWRDTRRDRYLLAAAFLMGLSMTHHVTSGLLLPAAALFVLLVDWRKVLEWRLVLGGAGLFLVGLLPYLYLPVRASMDPPMNEADPTSFSRFWELVNGGELTVVFGAFGPGQVPLRLSLFGGHLADEFHIGLLVVAMVGAAVAALKDRPAAVLLGFLFLGWLAYVVEYEIFDYFLYFIPPYLMLALFMTIGTGAILDGARKLTEGSPPLLGAAVVVLFGAPLLYFALADVRNDYASVDMSQDLKGRRIIEAVAEKTAPNATVLHHRSSLWYMVLVEERRRDLTLVSPWYPWWHRYTDLVWPDDIDVTTSNIRWGTQDWTGVDAARQAAKRGPVYIIDQESAMPQNFRDAGFYFVRVEKGLLYELVPPGGKPYTSIEEQQD